MVDERVMDERRSWPSRVLRLIGQLLAIAFSVVFALGMVLAFLDNVVWKEFAIWVAALSTLGAIAWLVRRSELLTKIATWIGAIVFGTVFGIWALGVYLLGPFYVTRWLSTMPGLFFVSGLVALLVLLAQLVYPLSNEDRRRALAAKVLDGSAPQWLQAVLYCAFVVLVSAGLFSMITWLLMRWDAAHVAETPDAIDSVYGYYVWHTIAALPGFDRPERLGLDEPLADVDRVIAWLTVGHVLVVVTAIVPALVSYWHRREMTDDGNESDASLMLPPVAWLVRRLRRVPVLIPN